MMQSVTSNGYAKFPTTRTVQLHQKDAIECAWNYCSLTLGPWHVAAAILLMSPYIKKRKCGTCTAVTRRQSVWMRFPEWFSTERSIKLLRLVAHNSLLPPDNATGNFTKIVQRVPVKIVLDSGQASVARLRPGLSVVATVRTNGTGD